MKYRAIKNLIIPELYINLRKGQQVELIDEELAEAEFQKLIRSGSLVPVGLAFKNKEKTVNIRAASREKRKP